MFRMKTFQCQECNNTFEELVRVDTQGDILEKVKCSKCNSDKIQLGSFRDQIHRDGARYRDVSWSLWSTGE